MAPTLLVGDYIVSNKFQYGIRNPFTNKILIPITTPKRGDVVVFIFPQDPSKEYIKRVVALPGEKIQIISKKVYINGKLLETPQAVHSDPTIFPCPSRPMESPRDNFGPVVVPQDNYFVMGDNRDHSYDSRFWGFASLDAIRGKALYIYFSKDQESFRVRWGRIGRIIH